MKPPPPVLAPLATLAQARRRHARRIALATALAILTGAVAAVAGLDTWLEWQPPVRLLLVGITLAGFTFLYLRWLRRTRRHDLHEAALVVEAAHPDLGQKIRTALDVSTRPPAPSAESAAFAERLMRETGKTLHLTPMAPLLPTRRLRTRQAFALATILAVAATAVFQADFRHALHRLAQPHRDLTYTTIAWNSLPRHFDETHPPRVEITVHGRAAQPELQVAVGDGDWQPLDLTRREDGRTWDAVFTGKTADIRLRILAGDARVEEKTIAYRPIPKLVKAEAELRFPDYTGLPSETVAGGDVRAVEGSTATWNFAFDALPARVTWSLGGAPPVELSPQEGAVFSTSTAIVPGTTRAELVIHHADGERLDAWRFEVEGVVDKLPVVEIIEPGKDLELIATAEMPVRIRATDDFGVSEIGLILDAGGERRWLLERVVDPKNQREINEIARLMLDQVPLAITDNVRFHAYALDHKPRGGPRSVSPLRAVDIRQFQMRWYFAVGGGGDEEEDEADPEAVSDAIMKLDEIIGSQRGIVSDVFRTKESHRNRLTPEALEKVGEQSMREAALYNETLNTAAEWNAEGGIPLDDVMLLETAGTQMGEAAEILARPDLAKGFDSADRALSTLLRLRKELITIVGRGKSPHPPKDPPPPSMMDLAKEARRIAAEEQNVASQITPENMAGNNIQATRRQQEVALADSGELYAILVDHPERSEGALRLIDEAEKAAARADKGLRSEPPTAAAPDLAAAERNLLDLALFLESLDLQRLSETLRELADRAEQGAREQQPSESQQPAPGSSGGASEAAGQAAAEAARETELAAEILEELAKKAESGRADPDGPPSATESTLEALTERAGLAELAQELEALAGQQQQGEAGEAAREGAAARLGALAGRFREAADQLDASRLTELTEAREQAAALKEALASQDSGEGNKPGKGGEGETPGGQGEGEMASQENQAESSGSSESPGAQGGGDAPGITGGPTLHRFADTLELLEDRGEDGVGRLAIPLRAAPFDRSTIPLVDAADRRLRALIERLPTDPNIASARGKLPEESRREIEDYFRDLSDDFGGEVWENQR